MCNRQRGCVFHKKKVRWKLDPPDLGEERMSTYLPPESHDQYQEELDQLRYDLLMQELEDEVRC